MTKLIDNVECSCQLDKVLQFDIQGQRESNVMVRYWQRFRIDVDVDDVDEY